MSTCAWAVKFSASSKRSRGTNHGTCTETNVEQTRRGALGAPAAVLRRGRRRQCVTGRASSANLAKMSSYLRRRYGGGGHFLSSPSRRVVLRCSSTKQSSSSSGAFPLIHRQQRVVWCFDESQHKAIIVITRGVSSHRQQRVCGASTQIHKQRKCNEHNPA